MVPVLQKINIIFVQDKSVRTDQTDSEEW